ncbi:MAG: response regulator transcription factor, partial [Chloroflexi bacterium]|nr:response regulator transcription factor [Chloroflexota bacterium]
MKVFVADDSSAVRTRVIRMLSEVKGVEVVGQAGDAPEALDEIRSIKPDAVILDIHMPSGSGIDMLQELCKEDPKPVVIMLTNYPYTQYRERCLRAGADYFFDKSNEFEKITEIFHDLLNHKEPPHTDPVANLNTRTNYFYITDSRYS